MSDVSLKATRSTVGHTVLLALAFVERLLARTAIRRRQRELADACVVMGA